MIFPAGKRKNLDTQFNPLTDDPRSPYYQPELKKHVKQAQRENHNNVTDPRSIDYQPEMKRGQRVKHEWAQPVAATKMSGVKQGALNRSNSISSAAAGGLSDIGGPLRHMKSMTNNSIFDTQVFDRLAKSQTDGEALSANLAKEAEARKQLKQSDRNFHIDTDVFLEALKSGILGKGNTVQNTGAHASDASNYSTKLSSHNMSIFDYVNPDLSPKATQNDFANLPVQTAGETIKQAASERRNKKDGSWQTLTPAASSRQKLDNFFSTLKKNEGK